MKLSKYENWIDALDEYLTSKLGGELGVFFLANTLDFNAELDNMFTQQLQHQLREIINETFELRWKYECTG